VAVHALGSAISGFAQDSQVMLSELSVDRRLNVAKPIRGKRAGDTTQTIMNDKVYKIIELTGTSTQSVEDAVNTALQRAGQTVKNLRWFEVIETRGDIEQDRVKHWQVTIKVGFTVE
jgi:dodecin